MADEEAPKSLSPKAQQLIMSLNALRALSRLPMSDAAVVEAIRIGLRASLDSDANLTSHLMLRCVNGDYRSVSMSDLDALNPRYPEALKEMAEYVLMKRNSQGDRVTEGKAFGLSTDEATSLMTSTGNTDIKPWDAIDDLGQSADSMSKAALIRDIGRALGDISMHIKDGHLIISDAFDLYRADHPGMELKDHIESAASLASQGRYSAANIIIGSYFCEEGPNDTLTETSIPIRFDIPLSTLTPDARAAIDAMLARSEEQPDVIVPATPSTLISEPINKD